MKTIKSLTNRNRNNVDDMGKLVGVFLIALTVLWTLS